MTSSGSKWLTGCGIGCLAVVLVAAGLGTAYYLRIRSRMQVFEQARNVSTQLERTFGMPDDFCPMPESLGRPRLQAFLEARRKAAPARARLEGSFTVFEQDLQRVRGGGASALQVFGVVRRAFGLVPELGEFFTVRNQALLDAGIGPGEYSYLYVLTFYSWLGKSPADGPSFRLKGREGIVAEDDGDVRDARAERRDVLTAEIRRRFLMMFRRQLDRLTENRAEAAPGGWREAVLAELTALESDPRRLPWQTGLPPAMAKSLEPFRQEFEASYSALVNPLELVLRMESYGWGEAESSSPEKP